MITHLNNKNKPNIVDISNKKQTKRIAIAQGIIQFSKKTFKEIESLKTKKGEITNTAIIAGILGAKKTSEIIPLCHNIIIENIDINIRLMKNKNLFDTVFFLLQRQSNFNHSKPINRTAIDENQYIGGFGNKWIS